VGEIRLHRVHDAAPPGGRRFLVDRVWPRGVRRHDLSLDGWLRGVAPSAELRKWFGHDPQRWPEFRRRYETELAAAPDAWAPLVEAAREGDVVLLYGARDREHNNAVALRDFLATQR
jgi:uncharacterized protein YeaO (DUF488 family)